MEEQKHIYINSIITFGIIIKEMKTFVNEKRLITNVSVIFLTKVVWWSMFFDYFNNFINQK